MKKKFFFVFALLLTATLSGCSLQFKTDGTVGGGGADGGVYRSTSKGNTWAQKTLVPSVLGRPGNFGSIDANVLALDPSDRKAIYLGAFGEGLFYSYDGAEAWFPSKATNKVTIRSIAVDPEFKCTIYATVDNKVIKTIDCARNWSQVYYDNDLSVKVNSLVIDLKNPENVFIGTSRGEVIKSSDRGSSWRTINRFDSSVMKLMISPSDRNIMFVATERNSLHRSTDTGRSWTSLDDKLADFRDSINFKDLEFSVTNPGKIFLASRYGLLKSTNNGDTWTNIPLITPENDAIINALAVSPKNDDEIYYVTNTTFYRSTDGGQNWTTKKLPTTRAGWDLLIDPEETSVIYMAVRKVAPQ